LRNNIVLIGFMASGKTLIGRALARTTKRFFLDCDALIEGYTGYQVAEIFEYQKEARFRELERLTAHWLERSVGNAVIATGGGMPTTCDNLRRIGETLYLECTFETVANRLKNAIEREKRPLAQSLEILQKRFLEREPIYKNAADRIIDANGSIEYILGDIIAG
jgi:shikimate kinase